MGIFSQLIPPVHSIMSELLSDENLSETLEYRIYMGQVFDEELGHNVDSFDAYEVVGARLRHDTKSVIASQGSIQTGDLYFLFQYEDLPQGISLKDRIVDEEGVEYKLKAINKVFELVTAITVDGV